MDTPTQEGPQGLTQDDLEGTDERLAKMQRLRQQGIEPYPHVQSAGRTWIADLVQKHDPKELAPGDHPELAYRIAGRIISRREHSKTSFLDVRDKSGQIQITARQESLGEDAYERLLDLDIGDIVSIEGHVYVTQRKDLTLAVTECTLLTKALRPPPDKYHGLEDIGTRYRYREIDLLANERTRELFVIRSKAIQALRAFMAERRFIEVETPILQTLPGGASARPFITHHNAMDRELSLRISVELYLNRCLIGGLENVYDLGKCFRNEGISYRHSPEFTMLEWLQSYSDHNDVARLTEEMITYVAQGVLGGTVIERDGERFDLAEPWLRTTMQQEILRVTGVDILDSDAERLRKAFDEAAPTRGRARLERDPRSSLPPVRLAPGASWAQAVHAIYSKLVEPTLIRPTLVFDFPLEQFPITKSHPTDPRLAEHFDAVIGGVELVSGDSEVNDPVEQYDRFVQQRKQRQGDDDDLPHPHDDEYVRSLQYGLAPSASGGMGVDRLLMILTGEESLREVITFPVMRDLR
ncbi:MAG: lysine--tRNA ligase [Solirubrobacteraceae bacterium]